VGEIDRISITDPLVETVRISTIVPVAITAPTLETGQVAVIVRILGIGRGVVIDPILEVDPARGSFRTSSIYQVMATQVTVPVAAIVLRSVMVLIL
jgi:hypothetical protein|tara:strand:+ start:76862 stop:77149 length:288 start_codon:yes stop_codon:yes gene_type:complete